MNDAALDLAADATSPRPRLARSAQRLAVPLCLVLTVAVAHFLRLPDFGLYEDDYYFVGEPLGWSLSQAVEAVASAFTGWPNGRPVGEAVPRFLSFVGGSLLGLPGVYLLGFAVIAANALLSWRVATRLLPPLPALVVALVFVLFPADTTRIFPTYALQMNVAQAFALLAADRLLARRTLAAMPFFALVLLTYETPSVPLFLVPLLAGSGWTLAWRRWLSTWAAMSTAILSALAARLAMGEARVVEAVESGLPSLLGKVAAAPFLGVSTSARLMATRPLDALSSLRPTEWLAVLVFATALAGLTSRLTLGNGAERADTAPSRPRSADPREPGPAPAVGSPSWTLFVGLLAWLAAYALAFTHWPPVAESGRATSVHGAATLGASLTAGALVWWLGRAARHTLPRSVLRAGIIVFCSLLVGFHLTVQRAFAESWVAQRALWRQVVALCPDLEEGTVIFIRPRGIPFSPMAFVSSWADPLVLELIFRFPREWSSVPRAFALDSEVTASFHEVDGVVRWRVPNATWRARVVELDPENVIVLRSEQGRLQRVRGKTSVNSIEIPSKRRGRSTVDSLPRGPLFALLLGDDLP